MRRIRLSSCTCDIVFSMIPNNERDELTNLMKILRDISRQPSSSIIGLRFLIVVVLAREALIAA